MAGKNSKKHGDLKSWCSASFSSKDETPFVVIGKSLLQHPVFTGLKASSRMMYLTMALLCRGQNQYTFGRTQEQRFGIAPKTALGCKHELEASGFIASKKQAYKPTVFSFTNEWKSGVTPKGGKKYTKPWLSANNDGKEETVLMVGVSLIVCDQFISLNYQTRYIYLAMAMEAGVNRNFLFPPLKAKAYGIKKNSLNRAEKELERANFIEKDPNALMTPGAYRFCFYWKHGATIRGKPVNLRKPVHN